MRRQGDTNFYLCEVSSNMIIDATNKGNMSRFINHSCEPNMEMQKWLVELYISPTSVIHTYEHGIFY
jgi:SET domain-containing protein